jgi:tetratricopeptide (TPR) repeat protein
MPRLFNKNNNDPPVNEETREWLENYFLWLIDSFGKENIKSRKVMLPHYNDFPIHYDGKKQSATDTLKIVALQMEINPDDINLIVYKEGEEAIDTGSVFGNRLFLENVKGQKYSAAQYHGKQEDGKYLIALEEKKMTDSVDMVASLAHELSHIKLLGEKRIQANNEKLTDLTTIVFGLGIFNANAAFQTKKGFNYWGWSRSGYLSQLQWGYSLALFSHLREEENPEWVNFVSENIKGAFTKSLRFIQNNLVEIYKQRGTSLKSESEKKDLISEIKEATQNRNFEKLIILYTELLNKNPNNKLVCNNLGYTLIKQKKYPEAIAYFDKAIKIDPKYDFALNNRGYCKLQIDDLKGAFEDISKACEMNPFNSFSWRNLGACYLKKKEFEKALENFEEAEKIDSKTELINFYLGKTHEKLGNEEKAKKYLKKSIEFNEYIDVLNPL